MLKELKISTDEIIIHFVNEDRISQLHKKFFNDPSLTDCITFPLDSPCDKKTAYHILGEAFICPKTALAYSKRLRIGPYEELYRYLTHCILHLIGHDDIRPDERAKMKRKEHACLKKLAKAGLLCRG